MQAKANGKQTLWVLLIALALIVLCVGGLWAYVKSADAETGLTETSLAELPEADEAAFTREKYDNYPVASDYGFLFENGKPLMEVEIRRLSKLVKAYAEGLRPISSAPSLPDELGFAIVPLDPNEFAGMSEYYFLPDNVLIDQELLMLIAYGEKAGAPFTENTLTTKNCARWFDTYCNCYLSAGESARRSNLINRVRMEGLRPESFESTDLTPAKLPISSVGGIRMYSSVPEAFYTFEFYPIQEMTDEELLQTIFLGHEEGGYTCLTPTQNKDLNPAEDKAKMRSLLENMMGMPMSANSTCLWYSQKDLTGEIRLNADFKSALVNGKETEYTVTVQMSSGKIMYIEQWTSYPYTPGAAVTPPLPDIHDRRWMDMAMKAVSRLTNEETTSASPTGAEANSDDMEVYISFDVSMKDSGSYAVNIRVSDGMLMSAQYLSDDVEPDNDNLW
jgi:hypothetical protein